MHNLTPAPKCTCRDCTAPAGESRPLAIGRDSGRFLWELRLCPTHLTQAIEWALDMRFQFIRADSVVPDPTLYSFVEFFEGQYLADS